MEKQKNGIISWKFNILNNLEFHEVLPFLNFKDKFVFTINPYFIIITNSIF